MQQMVERIAAQRKWLLDLKAEAEALGIYSPELDKPVATRLTGLTLLAEALQEPEATDLFQAQDAQDKGES